MPGEPFFADAALAYPALRLNFSHASAEAADRGLATLAYVEPHDFVSGPGERQVWLLTREAWLARQAS